LCDCPKPESLDQPSFPTGTSDFLQAIASLLKRNKRGYAGTGGKPQEGRRGWNDVPPKGEDVLFAFGKSPRVLLTSGQN